MRKNQRAALDALFSGKDLTLPSLIVRQRGEGLQQANRYVPTVYSYGDHFPLLMLSTLGGSAIAYLNTAKYSATTTSQQSGCALYLHYEGYRPTGDTIEHRGHPFAAYTLSEPESWPSGHYSGMFDRPAHHASGGK